MSDLTRRALLGGAGAALALVPATPSAGPRGKWVGPAANTALEIAPHQTSLPANGRN